MREEHCGDPSSTCAGLHLASAAVPGTLWPPTQHRWRASLDSCRSVRNTLAARTTPATNGDWPLPQHQRQRGLTNNTCDRRLLASYHSLRDSVCHSPCDGRFCSLPQRTGYCGTLTTLAKGSNCRTMKDMLAAHRTPCVRRLTSHPTSTSCSRCTASSLMWPDVFWVLFDATESLPIKGGEGWQHSDLP